jgi:hypothetical protein
LKGEEHIYYWVYGRVYREWYYFYLSELVWKQ